MTVKPDGLLRWWRRKLPPETTLLAGFLWLCALPPITTLVLPRLGGLVAALLALAVLLAAGVAAAAVTGPAFRPTSPLLATVRPRKTFTRTTDSPHRCYIASGHTH